SNDNVTRQRVVAPDAGRGPVNPRDDRDGERAHRKDRWVGDLAQRFRHVAVGNPRGAHRRQIGARAERITRAGQDNRARPVGGRQHDGIAKERHGFVVNRVATLRAVEGDPLDAVHECDEQLWVVGHSFYRHRGSFQIVGQELNLQVRRGYSRSVRSDLQSGRPPEGEAGLPTSRWCLPRSTIFPAMRLLRIIPLLIVLTGSAPAQIQIGTIRGSVADPAGAFVSGAGVVLTSAITGNQFEATTDQAGRFVLNNVPFNHYLLRVEARGFEPASRNVNVSSNLPLELEIRLGVAAASAQVTISTGESLVDPDSASTATTLSGNFIQRASRLNRGRELQELIVTTPGWTTENNGLIHVRGVDDGVLYVIDGIPISDRLDAVSASAIDTDTINTMNVITGNIPAEFGGRSGAVVVIHPKSGIDQPPQGSLHLGAGDFRSGDIAAAVGSSVRKSFGFFANAATSRSDRYLDPVDPRNFNNR